MFQDIIFGRSSHGNSGQRPQNLTLCLLTQDDYHVMVHHHAAALYIPASVGDVERTGIIVQKLAYESSGIVIPAYYDIASKVKLVRDERSAEMLDLIYSSRTYDPIFIYEFLDSSAFEAACRSNNKDIASYVAKNETSVNKMIQTVEDAYAALG